MRQPLRRNDHLTLACSQVFSACFHRGRLPTAATSASQGSFPLSPLPPGSASRRSKRTAMCRQRTQILLTLLSRGTSASARASEIGQGLVDGFAHEARPRVANAVCSSISPPPKTANDWWTDLRCACLSATEQSPERRRRDLISCSR